MVDFFLTFVVTQVIIILSLHKEVNYISEKKKMGRPTNNPKETMFRVRLDADTLQKLTFAAEQLKLSKSEVVRNGIHIVYGDLKNK